MGEVVPREWVMNALYEDDHAPTLSSLERSWEQPAQERMLEMLVAGHAVGMSAPMAELMRGD